MLVFNTSGFCWDLLFQFYSGQWKHAWQYYEVCYTEKRNTKFFWFGLIPLNSRGREITMLKWTKCINVIRTFLHLNFFAHESLKMVLLLSLLNGQFRFFNLLRRYKHYWIFYINFDHPTLPIKFSNEQKDNCTNFCPLTF